MPRRASLLRGCALVVTTALVLAACQRRTGRPGSGLSSGQWPGAPAPGAPAGGWRPDPAPQAPGGGAPAGDAQRILDAHAAARAEHCAPALAWSPDIALTAQRWADALAQRGCALDHSSGPLGENLAAGTAAIMTPERAVALWVEERSSYDFARGGFSMTTGHFTQVVWRGSQRLGCASATCGNGLRVWVCNYDPPGNMDGAFPQNVGPATCRR